MFHKENESGKSEYRRGIPFKPKKCWGKKVILTPKNININCVFNSFIFIEFENIKGNQWTIPDMIAKTAPIDNT